MQEFFKNILTASEKIIILFTLCSHNLYAKEVGHLKLRNTKERIETRYHSQDLLKNYIELTSFRHKLLAQNIANINTPGYKADEITTPKEYAKLASPSKDHVTLVRTSDNHLSGSGAGKYKFRSQKLRDPYEEKPNGNNVSLVQQMTKLSQNQQDYVSALKMYSAGNNLFSAVLGK